MSDPRPEELIQAENLLYNGKVAKALKIINNFQNKTEISTKEQLWTLLLRGEGFVFKLQFKEAVEVGDHAYSMSQELGLVLESIQALVLKTHISHQGKLNEALEYISQAEELLKTLKRQSVSNFPRIKADILLAKSWIYFSKGELNILLNLALQGIEVTEKSKLKLSLACFLYLAGISNMSRGIFDTALEYGMKGLNLMRVLDFQIGIAHCLLLIGHVNYYKGNLNKAIEFISESLSIKEISDFTYSNALLVRCGIYMEKGELDLGLEDSIQSLKIAEENKLHLHLTACINGLGSIYRLKGDYEKAIMYLKQSLTLSQKAEFHEREIWSLFYLFFLNLERGFNEEAQQYLERLNNLAEQIKAKLYFQRYLLAKAMMLKKKGLTRNRAEAERILIQIVEAEITRPDVFILAMVILSDFLLEELSEYNDPIILDELNSLIDRLINLAKSQNSSLWLAEGKLLQAKLALIQMDFDNTKKLLTQAQQIAEDHGLNLLAQKISEEHDTLLEKTDEWEKLQKTDAPMADRIELASVDGVLDRLQGKQTIDPPELVDEKPILLLIMDNSGVTYFNHPFITNWDHSDLFSSFMSAFNTFSSEIFSKSIDRIRIGENTILINPVEPFLACYVIKGQSYPALQKLTRFTEAIRGNPEIWQALNKSVKTSEMLELDKPPALKTVINEIFTQ